MDEVETWDVVEAQRLELVGLLEQLGPDEWERESLCAGWTVRDVVGHLTVISEPPPWTAFVRLAVPARGNPHRLNTLMSRHRAQREPSELVAALRASAGSRDLPVVTQRPNVLFDLLVHIQDVARPLGRDVPVPPVAAADALSRIWAMGWPFRARRRLAGVTLRATDAAWSAGEGPSVEGPAASLLLLLTGRPAGLDGLSGPGVERLPRLAAGTAVPGDR